MTERPPALLRKPEPYTPEEIEEAARAIPAMHAEAVRRCLAVAALLRTVRAMSGWPAQASLVSDVEELGRTAESLRQATSRPATDLSEAEAALDAIEESCAAFNAASGAVAAAATAAVATQNLPASAAGPIPPIKL